MVEGREVLELRLLLVLLVLHNEGLLGFHWLLGLFFPPAGILSVFKCWVILLLVSVFVGAQKGELLEALNVLV